MKNQEPALVELSLLERFPYPAVALASSSRPLYRNRMAKCLLPPLRELKEYAKNLPEDELLWEARLRDRSYAVIPAKREGGSVLCFFENFLPFGESFSRVIMEKMQDFFWLLLTEGEDESGEKHPEKADMIAARATVLRSQGERYLRLLRSREIPAEEARSCSLDGFIRCLIKALERSGIEVRASFPENRSLLAEPAMLSYLVLNLIHFVYLLKGERTVYLQASDEGERLSFSVSFPDCGGMKETLEMLAFSDRVGERILPTLPMFCILRVCLEQRIPWSVRRENENVVFRFAFPSTRALPAAFLTDPASKEMRMLLEMVRKFFF